MRYYLFCSTDAAFIHFAKILFDFAKKVYMFAPSNFQTMYNIKTVYPERTCQTFADFLTHIRVSQPKLRDKIRALEVRDKVQWEEHERRNKVIQQ